jgi:cytochrome P450
MAAERDRLPAPDEFVWLSEEINRCPFEFYESLRSQAPVYQFRGVTMYGTDVFLVSRWEDIVSVIMRPEVFEQFLGDRAPEYTEFAGACPFPEAPAGSFEPFPIFYSDGDDHKEKRKVGLRLVEGQLLKSKESIFREFADEVLDPVIAQGECDFMSAVAEPYPQMVIHELVGLPREELSEWTTEPRVAGVSVIRPVAGYVERVVLDRYKSPRADLISEIVREQAERDGGLDLNWHVANWSNVLLAGSVTSVTMLTNLMMHLVLNPPVMRRVRDDRRLLRNAIEESLRLETPNQVLPRVARTDTELGGVPIPAGSTLALLYGSGNRDPEKFADPTSFDLDRKRLSGSQLAFGMGKHHCLGAPLARLEAEILFNRLLDRTSDIRFIEEQSDLTRVGSRGDGEPMFSDTSPATLRVAFDLAA